jgi:hypothetical protein
MFEALQDGWWWDVKVLDDSHTVKSIGALKSTGPVKSIGPVKVGVFTLVCSDVTPICSDFTPICSDFTPICSNVKVLDDSQTVKSSGPVKSTGPVKVGVFTPICSDFTPIRVGQLPSLGVYRSCQGRCFHIHLW